MIRRFSLDKYKGFTLVEILVVIFIIGLIATVISLRFRTPTFNATPQAQAKEILRYMQIVQEQAILQPAVFRIDFNDHVYQVFQLQQDAGKKDWVSLTDKNKFWKAQKIPDALLIKLQTLDSQDNSSNRITFLPSGEVTPFELQLRDKDDTRAYVIKGDASGNLTLGVT